MKKALFFLSIIISFQYINCMIFYSNEETNEYLPPEIYCKIFELIARSTSEKKPKDAIQRVRNLRSVNRHAYTTINRPKISDYLINLFAHTYGCSHQTIAQYFHTQQSIERLALQYKLKKLCCCPQDTDLLPQLHELMTQGINLEFTYNYNHELVTPLMLAMNYDNNMFQYLLDSGAKINGYNSQGTPLLHYAIRKPIYAEYLIQITTNTKVNINQQNKRGDNALLYCLTHKNQFPYLRVFISTIQKLIALGLDPELPNQNGLTPLKAAKKIPYNTPAKLIKNAIKAKEKL